MSADRSLAYFETGHLNRLNTLRVVTELNTSACFQGRSFLTTIRI